MFIDPIKKFLHEVCLECFYFRFIQLEDFENGELSAMFTFKLDYEHYETNVKHFQILVDYFDNLDNSVLFNSCSSFGNTDRIYKIDVSGFDYMVCLRTHNKNSQMEKTHEFYLFPVERKLTKELEVFYVNTAEGEYETYILSAISKDEMKSNNVLYYFEGGDRIYDPIATMFHKNLMVLTKDSKSYLTAQRFIIEGV